MFESNRLTLVLCGGGSKGAVEVGFYRALTELGMPVDWIVGTSIGALNGALIAAGNSATEIVELWRNLAFSDLFGFNWKLLWTPRKASSLLSNGKLRRLLERYLPARFEDLLLPLTIIGTDLRTGGMVLLESGSLIDAILASVAVPGLLPPVIIEGREVVDGGLANNFPLDVAVSKPDRLILAMRCGCRRPLKGMPQGIVAMLSRSFDICLSRSPICEIAPHRDRTRIVVLEPCLDENIGLLDFSRSPELIEIGYHFALGELGLLDNRIQRIG